LHCRHYQNAPAIASRLERQIVTGKPFQLHYTPAAGICSRCNLASSELEITADVVTFVITMCDLILVV